MSRPPLEVADLIRAAGAAFIERNRSWIRWKHVKVLLAIERCRTAALGGHIDECPGCGYRATISYPEVPDRRSGTMDCCAPTRTSPHALHARGLHTPQPLGPTSAAEQEGHLRSLVPHQCGDPSRSGPRSETSRRGDWLLQCVAYLEPTTQSPSASPYHHSRRRPLSQSHPLGSLPKQILPPQKSVTQSLSRQIRQRSRAGFPRRPAPLRGKSQASRQT